MNEVLIVPDDREEHYDDGYRDNDLVVQFETNACDQNDRGQDQEAVIPFHRGKFGPFETRNPLEETLLVVIHRQPLERPSV